MMRRFRRILLRTALVLVVALLALYLLRGPLLSGPLSRYLSRELSAASGARVTIDAVAGGWLSDVELLGVRIETDSASVVVARLEAHYDVLPPRLQSVELFGLDVEVDLTRPAAPDVAQPGEPLDLFAVLDMLPELAARGSLSVLTAEGDVTVGEMILGTTPNGWRVTLHDVAAPHAPVTREFVAVLERESDALALRSDDALAGIFVREARYTRAGVLQARAELGEGRADVTWSPGSLRAELHRLDLANVPFLGGGPQGIVSGRLDLTGDALHARLEAADVRYDDIRADRVEFDGSWQGRAGTLRVLRASSRDARVEAEDIVVELDRPYYIASMGRLDIDVPDLRAYVTNLGERYTLHAEVLSAAPGRVSIRKLHAEGGGSTVSASGTARLPDDPHAWRETALDLRCTGTLASLHWLDAELPEYTGALRCEGTITGTLDAPRVQCRASGDDLVVEGQRVRTVRIDAALAWPRLDVSRLVLHSDPGEVDASGRLDLATDTVENGAFRVDIADLRAFASMFGKPLPVAGAIEGAIEGEGTFSWDGRDVSGTARIEARGLVWDGRAIGEASVDAVAEGGEVAVKDLSGRGAWGDVAARGRVRLDGRTGSGTFRVALTDLARLSTLLGGPPLQGAATASGTLEWDGQQVGGRANGSARKLVVDGRAVGTVSFDASAKDGIVRVRDVQGRGAWGNAALNGELDLGASRARVDSLRFEWKGRRGSQETPLRITWADGRYAATGLDLIVAGGRVRGRVAWTGTLDADLRGEEIDLAGLLDRVEGRAAFTLRADRDTFDLKARVPRLVFEGHQGRLAIDAVQNAAGIRVSELVLDVGDVLHLKGDAVLPWLVDADGLTHVEGVEPRMHIDALVRDVARFTGVNASGASIVLSGDAAGLRAEARVTDLGLAEGLSIPGESWLQLTMNESGLFASIATPETRHAHVKGSVRSDRGIRDWTRPEELRRGLEEARVSGELTVQVADLQALRHVVPQARMLKGRASVTVRLDGPLLAPEVTGAATLEDATFAMRGGLPPLQDGRASIRFDGRTLQIERLEGLLGYAPIRVTGAITLPGEKRGEIDLRIRGENVLLTRSRDLRLRADVDVIVRGPVDRLVATGKIRVTDALYSRPMELLASSAPAADHQLRLFSIRDGPLRTMRFDLDIVGDESFRVRNNLARGAFSLALKLRGTGEVPEPNGRVFFQDLLVRMPLTSLKVYQGAVIFEPEDPLAPRVRALARTRMKGIEMEIAIEGVVPDVKLDIQTRPPLVYEDALTLLTTGETPEDLNRKGAQSALSTVGVMLGRDLVRRFSGPTDPDEDSVFDRFEVDVGRDVTRSGRDTVEAYFRVARGFLLRGELDRFDQYNLGVVWRIRLR